MESIMKMYISHLFSFTFSEKWKWIENKNEIKNNNKTPNNSNIK